MIIFLNIATKFSEIDLSKPLTWDEYRIMIGENLAIFSQARARGFSDLQGQNAEDFIDYVNKIQLSKSGYTLNLFCDAVIGSTILEYLVTIFMYDKSRSNNSNKDLDSNLLISLVNTHDKIIRSGISF